MQNPFSTTFSKMPEQTYITTIESRDIIENFSYDNPTDSVYKITGLRGSGKTVILSKIQQEYSSKENRDNGWLVYNLNPSRDMLKQLAACLYNEDFVHEEAKSRGFNISANILGTGGAIGFSKEASDKFFDVGIEIKKMIEMARDKHKRILICVDEVSKTPEMMVFALEFGGWLISGYPVHFVCTGLYENVLELGNVKNLTFFRRGKTVETTPLNQIRMTEMYKSKLGVSKEMASELASYTKGYAYAFQKLGALYFSKGNSSSVDEIIGELKAELFAYAYEKIWEELSREDRYLASLLVDKNEYKREEVLKLMGDKANNYSVYRDRLIKRGIISARQGYVSINPPYFGEYIKEYCM